MLLKGERFTLHKIVVVGGGAAGMMAALTAAKQGNNVILLEKNEKLGKKIYITGKGRCNLSNYVDVHDFMPNVVTNSKFIYSSIYDLTPKSTYEFFEELGLKLKVERGNRVFPASDKASDVTKVLERALNDYGVDVRLNTAVNDICLKDGNIHCVVVNSGQTIPCDSVILCTGGISYPLTGSTGDGYEFAKKLGHTIQELKPALVGIELNGNDFAQCQGLSLKNVQLTCFSNGKKFFSDFGELLFTHFGISGPIVLSSSCHINKYVNNQVELSIDLKPALDEQTLNNRLLREFQGESNKSLFNAIRSLLPKSLVNLVIDRANIPANKKCCEITVSERLKLIEILKGLKFKVKKLRNIEEAIVTSGGVSVKEINPKTMESKLVKGLFFAGEIVDVDAYTGGFNLQIAFSMGNTAGKNA